MEDLNEVAVMTASVLVLFHQCVVDMFLCDTKCLYTSKVTISWQWKNQHSFCRHPVLNKAQPQPLAVSSFLSFQTGIFSLSVHHTLPSFLSNLHNPTWNLVSGFLTLKGLLLVFFRSSLTILLQRLCLCNLLLSWFF